MSKLKTVNVRGKDYVEVSTRLEHFRQHYPTHSLQSEIVSITTDEVVMVARVYDANGHIVATGHAHEDKSSSKINQTSYVENCETSAWGRALGAFGIGLNGGVATADEVGMAIAKQDAGDKTVQLTISNSTGNALAKQVEARLNGAVADVTRYLRSTGWINANDDIASLPDDKLRLILDRAESLIDKARSGNVDHREVKGAIAAAVRKTERAAA